MNYRLTKSDYLDFLKCPREFWLDHNMPELKPRETDTLEVEHLRQQGYAVQQLVKKMERFQTRNSASVNFERVFETSDLYARSDITVENEEMGGIDLYEIKASASIKDGHCDDVAFQKLAAEKSGVAIDRCNLITLNSDYLRRGENDVERLFVVTDVTEEVEARMDATQKRVAEAISYLESTPAASLADYCLENKIDCRFIRHHFPNLPDYTVFDIARLNNDKRKALLSDGIVDIRDIPDDFKLSAKQRIQVEAAKTGNVIIDRGEIAKRAAAWEYPLHFLDYETFSYAIPQFDGIRPFQQMCFQYSLHTIERPGDDLKHSYFLSRNEDDPPRALAESLVNDMAVGIGTVFVWYETFEKTRNSEMALMFPELSTFFKEINSKTFDLLKIFSDNLYVHPAFKGKSSIKKVLPVLRPELSYEDLGIGDGMTASISWYRAVLWDSLSDDERKRIFDDLEKYCRMDTQAMVEIFNDLIAL